MEGTIKLRILDIREHTERIETEPYGDKVNVLKIAIIGEGLELNDKEEKLGRYRFELLENSCPGKTAKFLVPGDEILLHYQYLTGKKRMQINEIHFDKDISLASNVKNV